MSSTDGSSQELHGTTLTVDQSVSLTIAANSLLILGMDYLLHTQCVGICLPMQMTARLAKTVAAADYSSLVS